MVEHALHRAEEGDDGEDGLLEGKHDVPEQPEERAEHDGDGADEGQAEVEPILSEHLWTRRRAVGQLWEDELCRCEMSVCDTATGAQAMARVDPVDPVRGPRACGPRACGRYRAPDRARAQKE